MFVLEEKQLEVNIHKRKGPRCLWGRSFRPDLEATVSAPEMGVCSKNKGQYGRRHDDENGKNLQWESVRKKLGAEQKGQEEE